MRDDQNGFTLIELLVVTTIIVILLALLTPALDKAISRAMEVRCMANHHASGRALTFYHADYNRYYPVMDIWWGLMGEKGNYVLSNSDVTDRPLNAYLGFTSDGSRVPVAECPADNGDPLTQSDPNADTTKMFPLYGTSYAAAYHAGNTEPNGGAGVKMIFGHSGGLDPRHSWGAAFFANPVPSVRHSKLNPLHNKVVNVDWPWHRNRSTQSLQTRWHRPYSEERYFSTLFADGHAEIFNWVKEYIDPAYGSPAAPPYDRSWKWW